METYNMMPKIGTRDSVLDRSCIMLQTSFHILKYILIYILNISIRLMIRKQFWFSLRILKMLNFASCQFWNQELSFPLCITSYTTPQVACLILKKMNCFCLCSPNFIIVFLKLKLFSNLFVWPTLNFIL